MRCLHLQIFFCKKKIFNLIQVEVSPFRFHVKTVQFEFEKIDSFYPYSIFQFFAILITSRSYENTFRITLYMNEKRSYLAKSNLNE